MDLPFETSHLIFQQRQRVGIAGRLEFAADLSKIILQAARRCAGRVGSPGAILGQLREACRDLRRDVREVVGTGQNLHLARSSGRRCNAGNLEGLDPGDLPLHVGIDIVRRGDPNPRRLVDHLRIGLDGRPQLDGRVSRHDVAQRPPFDPFFYIRKESEERIVYETSEVAVDVHDLTVGVPLDLDLVRIQEDVESDLRLEEGGPASADDREQENAEHDDRRGNRETAVGLEARLRGVAAADSGRRKIRAADRNAFGGCGRVSHTSLGICGRRSER